MNKFLKYPFAMCALLSASTIVQNPINARRVLWFEDSHVFDNTWIEDIQNFQRQSVEFFNKAVSDFGPSKEDREAIKASYERLSKIKHTVVEDDQKVTIQFSGFDALEKKDIKVVKKDHDLVGNIVLKDGKVEFRISQNAIQLFRRVELKKEDKDKKERVSYSSSLPCELEYFKQQVDVSTGKAESTKDKTLTIHLQKQKEEVLTIH